MAASKSAKPPKKLKSRARQSFLPQRRLRAGSLRTDFRDRQIAVQFAHDLAHRGGERGRFARRAQGEMHLADHLAFLLPRRVKQRLELFALAPVFGIGDDADDLDFTFAASIIVTRLPSASSLGKNLRAKV